ncbi:MAG: hypothetical protein ACREYF_03485 [Gammaproteobacteria bacterium]
MSIAEARSQLGTVVIVQGPVTVPSGAFTSFSFDQGFAIQDLKVKRKVRATGKLADSFGLLVLTEANVEILNG